MSAVTAQVSPESQSLPENPASIVGYDVAAVEAWIAANVDGLTGPFEWRKLEGGHSNITYHLTDTQGAIAVVRRPPMGELLPMAHDMGREFKIISGLHGTGVPVAKPFGYCESPDVTGAHFYVMSYLEGRPLFEQVDATEHLSVEARGRVGASFMEVLAALHSVTVDDVGLGDLGKREDYVGRQLRTWYRSWTASAPDANYDDPTVHRLHDLLTERKPEQGPARVVHGDYGLHNCLVTAEGNINGVLDWEISTLGDPLADFAYALNGWIQPDDPVVNKDNAPTLAPGFASRESLAAHYAERTGCDLSQLDFYRSFNYWKIACIIHGVYTRYVRGQKPLDGVDLDEYRERIAASIALSAQTAESLR